MGNFANFGIGVNALTDGFAKGLSLGKQINDTVKGAKLERAKSDAFNEAQQQHDADEAEGHAKPLMDYYMKTSAPRIRDAYLQAGDDQTAMAWDKWIQDSKVQKGMKYWANGVVAAQKGDHQGFLDNFMKSYNESGYFDDGTQATGGEVVKDKDGKPTGFKITFKDKNGNESTQQFDNMADIYQSGLAFMSPDSVFKYGIEQINSAKKAQAETNADKLKFDRQVKLKEMDQQFDVSKRANQQNFDISRDNNNSQNRITEDKYRAQYKNTSDDERKVREADAMGKALLSKGYTQQQVDALYPTLLGVQRESRSPSDELSGMLKIVSADPKMMSATADEKMKAAQELVDAKNQYLLQNGPSNQTNQPNQSGITTPPQGKGVLMYGPDGMYRY